jgi:bifunctional non-homologous end joining protein LigD
VKARSNNSVRGASKYPAEQPHFVTPMKARLTAKLPDQKSWFFEVKFDGIRVIAIKNGRDIELFSRKPRDLTDEYPDIVQALAKVRANDFAMDGEVVALDDKGRSSFQLLQNRERDASIRSRICYYVFDLLHLDGRNLKDLPLEKRKEMLKKILPTARGKLRFSFNLEGTPQKIWKHVQQLGLEGVVAKWRDSKYEPDIRSGAWLKIKTGAEQEFVIGGYTAPKGSRKFFGAILVGYYENQKFMFASKVGTGFDHNSLKSLHDVFSRVKADHCPFENCADELGGAEMRRCTWLQPKLVCQIKFSEWTDDGKLRQPVFLGLRADKNASEVVREIPSA